MAEYIDREAFKKSVEECYCKPCKAEGKDYNGCRCLACWVDDMLGEVECFSPSDVEPVRHGRWLPQIVLGTRVWDCSECKTIGSPTWKRCPVCEAKMDGDGNG